MLTSLGRGDVFPVSLVTSITLKISMKGCLFFLAILTLYSDFFFCFRLKMLSRLSGLASTVLQELSGDDGDAVTESSIAVSTVLFKDFQILLSASLGNVNHSTAVRTVSCFFIAEH